MDFYLNLLNDKERGPNDQPSIGIILCAEKDDVEVEYALRTKANPIGVAAYALQSKLPGKLKGKLPTAKQLAESELAEAATCKDYCDEQLERIRDIRSSEWRLYQKVLDIYATSVDYTPDAAVSQRFFATVRNKMHWAAHGQTAAEVIYERVDAGVPIMGLKATRPGGIIRKGDVSIAKNYLNAEELGTQNRIVNAYIEFGELRALQCKVMAMRDWITKLDEFLKLSEHEPLNHAGKITVEQAKIMPELIAAAYGGHSPPLVGQLCLSQRG